MSKATIKKVSVIVPAYKAEEYLAETIDSVLGQTFPDFELLVVVDDLEDECSCIVRKYGEKDSRVSLVHNTRGTGISGALNTGLKHARGEYVVRMDADDICHPSRFEKQVAYMDENPDVGVLGTRMSTFGAEEKKLWYPFPLDNDRIKVAFLFYTAVAHPTIIMRKEFFDKHDLKYDESKRCAEDYDLWTRAVGIFKFANLKDILLSYRLHDSNASSLRAEEHRVANADILKRQLSEIGVVPTDEEIDLHMCLYWGPYEHERSFVIRAEKWLLKLIEANKRERYFDSGALRRELRKVFFKVCRGSSLGFFWGKFFLISIFSPRWY